MKTSMNLAGIVLILITAAIFYGLFFEISNHHIVLNVAEAISLPDDGGASGGGKGGNGDGSGDCVPYPEDGKTKDDVNYCPPDSWWDDVKDWLNDAIDNVPGVEELKDILNPDPAICDPECPDEYEPPMNDEPVPPRSDWDADVDVDVEDRDVDGGSIEYEYEW